MHDESETSDGFTPPTTGPTRIAVIGGGITGLAAAHRLTTLSQAARVTVFEASDRLGGIIQTRQSDGFLIELGPDAFITNKPGGVQLCEEIGFSDQLIPTDNQFRRSLVLRNGKPLPVPDGFMLMAPAKPMAIATTPILSVRGKARLLWEAFVPPGISDDDESLADFVRRRFGAEALNRLVQPLIGGIYTSDPEKLSLQATLPRFIEMEKTHGSVIRATLAEQKRKRQNNSESSGSGARYGLFTTPKNGFSSLISALEANLATTGRVDIRTSTAVQSIRPAGGSWQVTANDAGETFDAVIITLPTHHAAKLLTDPQQQPLAGALSRIEYASSAIVVSAHRLDDFAHPLDAFGLVIPAQEKRNTLAVSFTSRKFPHRAPEGHVLVRTFVGGAMQPELLEHDNATLQQLVNDDLRDMLGMKADPIFAEVARYQQAMPQYHVGHTSRVTDIENLATQAEGLYFAGSAYHGVGIPDSILSGRQAAQDALAAASKISGAVS